MPTLQWDSLDHWPEMMTCNAIMDTNDVQFQQKSIPIQFRFQVNDASPKFIPIQIGIMIRLRVQYPWESWKSDSNSDSGIGIEILDFRGIFIFHGIYSATSLIFHQYSGRTSQVAQKVEKQIETLQQNVWKIQNWTPLEYITRYFAEYD